MSETGTRLSWDDASRIAQKLFTDMEPAARRVKTVGSVRRRRPDVGDIELLVEPRMEPHGLFGEMRPDVESIRAVAAKWGEIVKGGEKMLSILRPDGVKIEVYMVTPPAQWGSLLAIRTGPGDLGKHAVSLMIERGLRHVAGHVEDRRTGEVLSTATEEEFFVLAGLPCLPPHRRDSPEAYRPLARRAVGVQQ